MKTRYCADCILWFYSEWTARLRAAQPAELYKPGVNADKMGVRQSVTDLLIGNPPRRRSQYVGVAVGLAVLVAVLLPSEWIGTHIWWFGGVGVLIALTGGVGSYGLVSALCGTGPYIAVIGEAAFLASSSATYSISVIVPRLTLVLAAATATITVPSYLLGVGVRTMNDNWTE